MAAAKAVERLFPPAPLKSLRNGLDANAAVRFGAAPDQNHRLPGKSSFIIADETGTIRAGQFEMDAAISAHCRARQTCKRTALGR